ELDPDETLRSSARKTDPELAGARPASRERAVLGLHAPDLDGRALLHGVDGQALVRSNRRDPLVVRRYRHGPFDDVAAGDRLEQLSGRHVDRNELASGTVLPARHDPQLPPISGPNRGRRT